MTEYNGHRSWNAWNVALWINNEEPIYQDALNCLERAQSRFKNKTRAIEEATRLFLDLGYKCTPDGAKYNHLNVKLVMAELYED